MPTILVVDDDPAILNLYRRVLQKAVAVETAHDGIEAIKKIRSRSYPLILLDLMMPQMSGFQVIEYMKLHQPELLKSVVVVTALSPEAYRRSLDETLVQGLVAKPFDVEQIVSLVRQRVIGRGHGSQPL